MPKKKKKTISKRALLMFVLVFTISTLAVSPVLTSDSKNKQVTVLVQGAKAKGNSDQKKVRKDYLASIKNANAEYRDACKIAKSNFLQSLKSAQTKAEKKLARKNYDNALKLARLFLDSAKNDLRNNS